VTDETTTTTVSVAPPTRYWRDRIRTVRHTANPCRRTLYRHRFAYLSGYPWGKVGQLQRLEVWKGRRDWACARVAYLRANPAKAIRFIFGSYGDQAVAVAYCESHLYVGAQNGQYLGLFQMGTYARSRYGHSWEAIGQSRSAYGYFVGSGRDWSPWQCRPWGLAW
jgi:hypothetical protein